jgi:hypothetical protein
MRRELFTTAAAEVLCEIAANCTVMDSAGADQGL